MKKLISLFLLSLLLLQVVSAADFVVSSASLTGNPGATVTGTFTIQNTGSTTLSNFQFIPSALLSGTQTIPASAISFSPSTISIPTGITSTITLSVAVPAQQLAGTYTGTVNVTNGTDSVTMSVNLAVQSSSALSILTTQPLIVSGEPDNTRSVSFIVKNTGNVDLSSVGIPSAILGDNDGDNITVSFTSAQSLTRGQEKTFTLTAEIDNSVDVGLYSGSLLVQDAVNNLANQTLNFEVRVQPEVCSDGVVGNLVVDLRNPDDGDDFEPGQTMDLEVKVNNEDDNDLDVIVEAFLYNVDQDEEVERVESETEEIKEGRTKTFEFSLDIPTLDVDEDDDYVLFVKAYEDGSEDDHCAEDSIDIDIKRAKHEIAIQKFTATPNQLTCGDTFDVIVELENIGTTDEDDIAIRLLNDVLNIDVLDTRTYSLDKFEDNDNEATVRFTGISIPEDALERSYDLEVVLDYNSNREQRSAFTQLMVRDCQEEGEVIVPVNEQLQLLTSSFTVDSKSSVSLPVRVSNMGTSAAQYTLEVINTQEFAEPVSSKTVFVSAGQSETVYFVVLPKDNAKAGTYSATVNLLQDGQFVNSKSFTVNVQEKEGIFSGIGIWFSDLFSDTEVMWIVLDIILLVLAVLFVVLIFRSGSKKRKQRQDDEDVEVKV